jgi:signal transduction histidine kinase
VGRRLAALDAEVDEMQALIDDLIASARLEQGLVALRREPTPARELLLEALASVDLGEREVVLDAPEDLVLEVDHAYLRRAVVNLLTNVARYTPADARVWIGARVEGGAALLAVEDDGPGLPRGQIDQLFTPFFRAEASRSRATGGLGLGLVVVRQVATLHGGAAGAAASPRGGLRVWLRIPLTRAIHSEGSAPGAART